MEYVWIYSTGKTAGETYQDDLDSEVGIRWTLFYPNGPQKWIYKWQWNNKTDIVGQM